MRNLEYQYVGENMFKLFKKKAEDISVLVADITV